MNFIVTSARMAKTMAWTQSVAVRFILLDGPDQAARVSSSRRRSIRCPWCRASRASAGGERVRGREPERDAHADDERRVDQAKQQEDLGLQDVHQLRLAGRGLDVLARHDADADAGTDGTEPDD